MHRRTARRHCSRGRSSRDAIAAPPEERRLTSAGVAVGAFRSQSPSGKLRGLVLMVNNISWVSLARRVVRWIRGVPLVWIGLLVVGDIILAGRQLSAPS